VDFLPNEPFPRTPDTAELEKAAQESFKAVWGGDHKNVPGWDGKRKPCGPDGSGNCPLPSPNCYGRAKDGKNRYTPAYLLYEIIEKEFCPKLSEPGRKWVTFNGDQPEEVRITWKGDSEETTMPNPEECKFHLDHIVDDCDEDMAIDWKGGGNLHVGEWYYEILPNFDRPPADSLKTPLAWCTIHPGYAVDIWGAGFYHLRNGTVLKDVFADNENGQFRALDQWTFDYDLMDGHEWRAYLPPQTLYRKFPKLVRGDEILKAHVEDVLLKTANFDGFQVDCKIEEPPPQDPPLQDPPPKDPPPPPECIRGWCGAPFCSPECKP
jgi:hypothetical protein